MNILVTGGTGFIGSNLCRELVKQGHQVFCLDNNYTGSLDNVQELMDKSEFCFIEHDICNRLDSIEKLQGVKLDRIYNLACPASPPAYQGKHSLDTTKTCVYGAFNVLDLAIKHDAVILQASTSEVYGDPLVHPQKETYLGNVNPNGIRACYDEGKHSPRVSSLITAVIWGQRLKSFVSSILMAPSWPLMMVAWSQTSYAKL